MKFHLAAQQCTAMKYKSLYKRIGWYCAAVTGNSGVMISVVQKGAFDI